MTSFELTAIGSSGSTCRGQKISLLPGFLSGPSSFVRFEEHNMMQQRKPGTDAWHPFCRRAMEPREPRVTSLGSAH